MQAVHVEHDRKMDHPSNGVSIVGCLRPAFADEESYLRRLFHFDYDEGSKLDRKGFLYFHRNTIIMLLYSKKKKKKKILCCSESSFCLK